MIDEYKIVSRNRDRNVRIHVSRAAIFVQMHNATKPMYDKKQKRPIKYEDNEPSQRGLWTLDVEPKRDKSQDSLIRYNHLLLVDLVKKKVQVKFCHTVQEC